MSKEIESLVRQHHECDDQLNRIEAALQKGDSSSALRNFRLFNEFLDAHFVLEEKKLFPALEKITGMTNGPTEVMRQEHQQIRSLKDELKSALDLKQTDQALATIDTLNVMIQQHNIKEENILYPMCEAHIPDLTSALSMGGCCGGCS
jgi:hemerythrin-like domain-containing protein